MKKSFSVLLVVMLLIGMVGTAFADQTYVVKSGDVLWKIAKQHGVGTAALAKYNAMKNPNLIFPGDIIKIPTAASAATSQSKPVVQPTVPPAMAKTEHVIILHTNDMHGFFLEGKYDGMGLAKIANYRDRVLAGNPATFLVDGGDALQGNNLVTVSDGETGTNLLNIAGFDAMVAGNHEFDYGSAQTIKLAKMLNFPMLSANVRKADGSNFLMYNTLIEKNGVKVGFFGLTTPETTYKSHPDNTVGLKFLPMAEVAREQIAELKGKGAQIVVCLAHLGDEGDYTSSSVAAQVDGIDLIVDGHSHTIENTVVNNTLIVQTGAKTKNLGRVDFTLQDGKIVKKEATLLTKKMMADFPEDREVTAGIDKVVELNKPILGKVIAKSPIQLDGEKAQVRTGETNLGNIIVEAFLDISKADIAFTNGGGIRSSLAAGDITVGDILTVLPYGNTVRVIELSGADVKAALENGFSTYPEPLGGFPHVAGLTVSFDASKPAGERVVEVKVGGKALDLNKTYSLVTNDFLVAGGDAYDMFKGKKVIGEFGAMDEVLIDYINKNGFDKAKTDGRIKEISQSLSFLIELLVA